MCKELNAMKDRGLFSKSLIIRLLCHNDFYEEVVGELKHSAFQYLKFDYMDIQEVLSANIPQDGKDIIIKELFRLGRVEVDNKLVRLLVKNNREDLIDILFSFFKKNKDRIGLCKLISCTNYLRHLPSDVIIDVSDDSLFSCRRLGGNTLIYDHYLSIIIYRDFSGSMEEFEKFYNGLKRLNYLTNKDHIELIKFKWQKFIYSIKPKYLLTPFKY